VDGTVQRLPVLKTFSAASAEKQKREAELAAVTKSIEKLIEEINEWGILRLEELDFMLLDDRCFDATTNYRV
jgi:hypothetical protein